MALAQVQKRQKSDSVNHSDLRAAAVKQAFEDRHELQQQFGISEDRLGLGPKQFARFILDASNQLASRIVNAGNDTPETFLAAMAERFVNDSDTTSSNKVSRSVLEARMAEILAAAQV